jgi:tRNA 2-thiocytidine biosynthesis protein TtcA
VTTRTDSRTVLGLVHRAVRERALVESGDKILIAVSGGKDSTVLAWALAALRPAIKVPYELCALHISSDFCSCCKKSALAERLNSWGIPFDDLFVPVIGRLKPGRSMNCYWCSTQRRTELITYAIDHGCNKIALGHHLDDIVETFFMNLLDKGDLSAMQISMPYRKYPVTLIRPLGFCEERQVISAAAEQDILRSVCTCPYGLQSQRRVMRERIKTLTNGSGAVKRRIIAGLGDLV